MADQIQESHAAGSAAIARAADPLAVTQPFAPRPNPVRVASADLLGPKVLMLFPKRVVLTTQDFRSVVFEAGPQAVPVDLATQWPIPATRNTPATVGMHPYLAANGVTPYDDKGKEPLYTAEQWQAKQAADLNSKQQAERHVQNVRSDEADVDKDPRVVALKTQIQAEHDKSAQQAEADERQRQIGAALSGKDADLDDATRDAAESARTGKPVEQVRQERLSREASGYAEMQARVEGRTERPVIADPTPAPFVVPDPIPAPVVATPAAPVTPKPKNGGK